MRGDGRVRSGVAGLRGGSTMKVFVAQQVFAHEEQPILGVFSTAAAAKAACGPSSLPWVQNGDDGWWRDEEWSREEDRRSRALLRWESCVIGYEVDVPADTPYGSSDPYKHKDE